MCFEDTHVQMVMVTVVSSVAGRNTEPSGIFYYELTFVGNDDDNRIIHGHVWWRFSWNSVNVNRVILLVFVQIKT